jgi:hypothetical protein
VLRVLIGSDVPRKAGAPKRRAVAVAVL